MAFRTSHTVCLVYLLCITSFHEGNEILQQLTISSKMRTVFLFLCSSCSAFSGPQRHQQMKAEARMNTISTLLGQESGPMSQDNQSALQSLLKTDTYLSDRFSDEHTAFKSTHNDVFVQLIRHCSRSKSDDLSELDAIPSYHPVFYLDGADGASTIALRRAGLRTDELYVANIFKDTVSSLKYSHGLEHVYQGRAEDVLLLQALEKIPFVAYYLDGCGGRTRPIMDMLDGIFSDAHSPYLPDSWVVGITLTEADPTGRSLCDREQDITRALSSSCRACLPHAFTMCYVGDDPTYYGLTNSPPKLESGTKTTWIALTRNAKPQ